MAHSPSFGSTLSWDNSGGSSYTAIGQVKDIGGPSISRGTIDVSDHDSADGYREFLGGLADGGELTFTIGFDNTNAEHTTNLPANLEDDTTTPAAWELDLTMASGTAVWTFDGFLTGFAPGTPVEGEQTIEVTVKVTGKPTLAVT